MPKSFFLIVLLAAAVSAQTATPATHPATAPAAAPTTVTFPNTFIRVTAADHVAVCEPADEKWVRAALAAAKPATRPTTTSSDILSRIQATRADMSKQLQADALLSPAEVDDFYDKFLIPAEQHEVGMKVHIVFLVTTKARLIELMQNGFELPNLHFNRLTNEIDFSPNLMLTENEQAIHSLYDPSSTEASRAEILASRIQDIDTRRMSAQASESAILVQRLFVGFIGTKAILPLKLHPDQEWFGLGSLGWLGVKYAVAIVGLDRDTVIGQFTVQPPRSPYRIAAIDLLHPSNPSEIRREYVPAYIDAFRRRSTLVMANWIKRDGDQVIPKTLAALKNGVPADGAGFVKMIKDATGADLTQDLVPQP